MTLQIMRKRLQVNRTDLVNVVADSTALSKADAAKVVDAVLEVIKRRLKQGDSVRIMGFGTFTMATRNTTAGRHPRTGEPITLPVSKRVKFKAGKALKRVLA